MPRNSLHPQLKSLKTYEVLVTQTTEDEIRFHIKSIFDGFELAKDKYTSRASKGVGELLDNNPYLEKDWKKGTPTRHYKERSHWFGDNEFEMEEYMKFGLINHDVIVISKVYEWEELEDMKNTFKRYYEAIKSYEEDILKLEDWRFFQAKKKFEEENKEWIEEQAEIKKHKAIHHSAYILRKKEEEGEDIQEDLKCKYCNMEYSKEIELLKKVREYEANRPQLNIIYENTPIENKLFVKPPEKICEDCGYKTTNKYRFDEHFNEPQHKRITQLKEWYCEPCLVQCQSRVKHEEHLVSAKHKKNIGELKKSIFTCEACEYTTNYKHHYDQHLSSKKHNDISNK
jgi:hypothetical protein